MYGSVHQPAFRIGFWIMFLRANRPRLPICIQLAEIISYETTAREDTKQPLSRYCISRVQQLEIREVRNNKITAVTYGGHYFARCSKEVDISSQKSREDRYSKLKWFSRSATRRSKELTCTPDSSVTMEHPGLFFGTLTLTFYSSALLSRRFSFFASIIVSLFEESDDKSLRPRASSLSSRTRPTISYYSRMHFY